MKGCVFSLYFFLLYIYTILPRFFTGGNYARVSKKKGTFTTWFIVQINYSAACVLRENCCILEAETSTDREHESDEANLS